MESPEEGSVTWEGVEEIVSPMQPMRRDSSDAPDTDPLVVVVTPPARSLASLPAHLLARSAQWGRRMAAEVRGEVKVQAVDWPADAGHQRGWTAVIRSGLLGGQAVTFDPLRRQSVLDHIIADLDSEAITSPRIGSGGGMAVTLRSPGNGLAILRLGMTGTIADPTPHYQGLLRASGMPFVPSPLAHGSTNRVSWSLESRLAGDTVPSLTLKVTTEVDRILRDLPVSDTIEAPFDALDFIEEHSARPEGLAEVRDVLRERLAGTPGIMIHGDLWIGNLLVDGDNVVGVVDWDSWHPAGAPMTDLIHLFADEERRRGPGGYGDLVVGMFWRSRKYRPVLERHLIALSIGPTREMIDMLAVAWWGTATASALRRNLRLRRGLWLSRNVDGPIETALRLIA